MEEQKKLFIHLGLPEREVVKILKNESLVGTLTELTKIVGVSDTSKPSSGTMGIILLQWATKGAHVSEDDKKQAFLTPYVQDGRIGNVKQMQAALTFLKKDSLDADAFEKACGVGLGELDKDTVQSLLNEVFQAKQSMLDAKKWDAFGPILGFVSKQHDTLKWADMNLVRELLQAHLQSKYGPKPDKRAAALAEKQRKQAEKEALEKAAQEAREKELGELKTLVLVDSGPDDPFLKIREADKYENKRAHFHGWVESIREAAADGTLFFVEIRDGSGYLQTVFSGKLALQSLALSLRRECTILVAGTLTRPPEGKYTREGFCDLELGVDYWKMIGESPAELEDVINKDSNVPQLFDNRHLHIRWPRPSAYLKLRSVLLQYFRQYYFDHGFFEVQPPTLVQTQAEGGSELFQFKYYGEDAYLTQSSQLYLETVLPAVGDTFCIVSSYRAEKSRTRRHLAEYTHLEGELAFITFDDLLNHIEDLICSAIQGVLDSPFGALLKRINPDAKVPKRPFRRMDYTEALEFCKEHNIYKDEETKSNFEFGDDIPEMPERKMIEIIGEPTFLCRFPVTLKAFYMPKDPKDPRVTESTDLLMPGVGEIVGASMRIKDYDELMAAYQREGIDASPYYWFTDLRKYGTCPHGGYGIGVERFLVWLFGDDHIRNVCLYPRYMGRCQP